MIKYIKYNLLLFIIIFTIKLTQLQSVPSIPCPDIFSYVRNSKTGQIEGRIILTITKSGENVLLLKMAYPPDIINDYAGGIRLTKNNVETTKDIAQNLPIIFRIDFPTTDPVPTVQEIISNNQIICSNPDLHDDGSEIILTHKLNVPNTIQLAGNFQSSRPNLQTPVLVNKKNQNTIQNSQSLNIPNSGPISCGTTTTPINLIFGGKKMTPGSWPWLIAMFVNEKGKFTYICAGNLITQQGIITAAHCVSIPGGIRNPQDIKIGLGIYNIDNWNEPNSQIAGVSNIIPHPEYSRQKLYDADIAVVILDRPYSYTNFIRPVCMWRDEFGGPTDRVGQVAGWGIAKVDGGSEKEPSIVEARIVSDQKCLRSNEAFGSITSERNLCAGYRDDRGPCQGDSGSGLIVDIGGTWYLRAIVSGAIAHIRKTCDLRQYVIYTDVAQFSNWINQYIRF